MDENLYGMAMNNTLHWVGVNLYISFVIFSFSPTHNVYDLATGNFGSFILNPFP